MTELETMQRAKMYMDKLAQGIDPITGNWLPDNSALNHVRLARCFSYVSGILEQVIANGGQVGAIQKTDFSITPEQLAQVRIASHPVRISELADAILAATGATDMKRPNVVKVNNWLTLRGYLAKEATPDGKSRRVA